MKKTLALLSVVAAALLPAQPAVAATTIVGVLSPVTVSLDSRTVVLTPPVTNSPGAWSVSVNDATIATANGLTLTLLKAGSTGITFTIAASGEYGAASRSTQLYVEPGTPTFGSFSNVSVSLGQNSFKLTPPISNSPGSWSYISSNPLFAAISGDSVTVLDAGSVTITATQAATAQWKSGFKTMTLTITALTPILGTFTNISLTLDSVASVNLVTPTSTSAGAWTLSSSNAAVASISNLSLTPRSVGTTVITASQARFGNFKSITTSMTVTVLAAPPTISTGAFVDQKFTFLSGGVNTFALTAPSSNSAATWNYTSSDPLVATTSGSNLTALKPGVTKVTAIQNAAGKYGNSAPVTISVTINGVPSYVVSPDFERLVGDIDYVFQFPATLSGGAWSIASDDSNIVTVQGNLLKFTGAGTATITIKQAAFEYWLEGSSSFKVRVIGQTPLVGTLDPLEVGVGQRLTFSSIKAPVSQSLGAWEYASLNSKIAQIVNGEIVGVAAGQTAITATQKPSGKFGQSKVVQSTINVKVVAILDNFANLTMQLGASAPQIKVPNSASAGQWSFTSSNPAIADVVNGSIVARSVGTITVTAIQSASALYAKSTKNFTVVISAAAKPAVVVAPGAKVSTSQRTITITVSNIGKSQAAAYIDGKKVRFGKTTVKAGTHTVKVNVGGKRIFYKSFTIR